MKTNNVVPSTSNLRGQAHEYQHTSLRENAHPAQHPSSPFYRFRISQLTKQIVRNMNFCPLTNHQPYQRKCSPTIVDEQSEESIVGATTCYFRALISVDARPEMPGQTRLEETMTRRKTRPSMTIKAVSSQSTLTRPWDKFSQNARLAHSPVWGSFFLTPRSMVFLDIQLTSKRSSPNLTSSARRA